MFVFKLYILTRLNVNNNQHMIHTGANPILMTGVWPMVGWIVFEMTVALFLGAETAISPFGATIAVMPVLLHARM